MELTREPVENLNKMVYYNKILKKIVCAGIITKLI